MLKRRNRPIVEKQDAGWTARSLPGGIYCAPRCGCKCTKADYDKAVQASQALVDQLGDGWIPRVWENGGWHWRVGKGSFGDGYWIEGQGIEVSFDKITSKYEAQFRSALTGTNTRTQFYAEASTAEEAIGLVRQDVRTFISRLEADLAASL